MKKIEKSNNSRRDFLKKNILGALFFSTGLPFVSFIYKENKYRQSFLPKLKNVDTFSPYWKKVRESFLFGDYQIYFNTASLGPSPKIVVHEICQRLEAMETKFGSIGANGHGLEEGYDKVANFFNTTKDQIAVTRNTTEGMNIIANSIPLKEGDEVIITNHEHVGGASPWLLLSKKIGIKVTLVHLDLNGEGNLERIKKAISPKTKAVSFSHVCYTTGLKLPAKEIVNLCRENEIYSCIDGAQAAGMIEVDLGGLDPDFYATSGHKWLFGPKGTGILFINNKIINQINPVFAGSYFDSLFDLENLKLEYRKTARREEYGTRNLPMIAGLIKGVEFIQEIGIKNIEERGKAMNAYLINQLENIKGVEILSPLNPKYSSAILTIKIKESDNLQIVKDLYQRNQPLRLRGVFESGLNAMRISLAVFNQKEDLDELVTAIKEVAT